MASDLAGFRTICVKSNEKCVSYHYLYYKKHETRDKDESKPQDKTLFVVNIPPYCTKRALKHIFRSCGSVQNVDIVKHPGAQTEETTSLVLPPDTVKGFKVGFVVFKKLSSLDAALNLDSSTVKVLSTPKHPVVTGMKKWVQEYQMQYPDASRLQAEVNEFMANYDAKKEQLDKEAAEARNQPDEEGWITVGSSGRKAGARIKDVIELQERRKKKKPELLNFYRFQIRETKREFIANLRKKFEEDKKRIAEMKSARKFRPY